MVSSCKVMTSSQPIVLRSHAASTSSAVAKLLLSLVISSAQEAPESPMPGHEHFSQALLMLSARMNLFKQCLCLGTVPCATKRHHCFAACILSQQTYTAPTAMSLQDTFTTPLPHPRPLRRASADIPGSTLTASAHLRKAYSHREGISKSPSGAPGTPFTPLVYKASSHQQLPRKQSIFSAIK